MRLAAVNNHLAATLKAERERDKIQAMRDYQAEIKARQANMVRLRTLRLAKESTSAQPTHVARRATRSSANRLSILTRAGKRTSS